MSQTDKVEVSIIQAAIKRGDPIYEVKSCNVTTEWTPNIMSVRKAVADSHTCCVYLVRDNGTKQLVAHRINNKMVVNTININVG